MRGRGRCAVRVRLAAAHPRRAAPHDRRRRRSSLRPPAGIPSAPAAELPGPTGFYLTLVLLAVVLGLSAAAAIKLRQRARVGGLGDPKRHGARWARAGDLGRLYRTRRGRHVTAPPDASRRTSARATGHGLSLGHRGARLLRAEDRHALVVFGPTQSGKSAGIAIPNILEWEGPAIVVSIKPDLLDATLTARAQRGKVLVFDPLGQWKQPSHTWSPLASSSSWNGALQTAQRMASAGETDTSTVKGGSFWSQAAEQRLAPLLYAAARTRRGWARSCAGSTARAAPSLTGSCTTSSRTAAAR